MTFSFKHLILVGQSEKNGRVDFWWAKEGVHCFQTPNGGKQLFMPH